MELFSETFPELKSSFYRRNGSFALNQFTGFSATSDWHVSTLTCSCDNKLLLNGVKKLKIGSKIRQMLRKRF